MGQWAELLTSLGLGANRSTSICTGATYFCVPLWLLTHDKVSYLFETWPGGLFLKPIRQPLDLNCSARASCPMAATNYSDVYKVLAVLITRGRSSLIHKRVVLARQLLHVHNIGKIPFAEHMDIPLPYTRDSDQRLLACHVAKMATKHFMEDGEWVGYRCMTFVADPTYMYQPYVYPAAIRINFKVNSRMRHGAVRIFACNASYERDQFDLDGVLYPRIGRLFLTKRHHGGNEPIWTMSLALTPFGLVGSWKIIRSGPDNGIGGWLWLWKRSWSSDKPPPQGIRPRRPVRTSPDSTPTTSETLDRGRI